jgi:hypothetical protein
MFRLGQFLSKSVRPHTVTTSAYRRTSTPLGFEALEDRYVLSTMNLIHPTDGNIGPAYSAEATIPTTLDTPNKQYVAAAYQDLFHRSADAAGLKYWSDLLDHGTSRSDVALALTHSKEYFSTAVQAAYGQFFGRNPSDTKDSGLDYWTDRMMNGLTDEQLETTFLNSAEFRVRATSSTSGNDNFWIEAIYQKLLGRAPEPTAESACLNQLDAKAPAVSDSLVRDVVCSQERQIDRVQHDYETFLGRQATPDELKGYGDSIEQRPSNADLVAGCVGSEEYFKLHATV